LVPRVQAGELPVDALLEVDGGLRPLVPVVQAVLRELREQQITIAALEAEMRQRIANRTDALERTIGSLRHQATRDALTGLFNRRFMDQFLAQTVQRHLKERKDLSLLMIDIDHFKLLNDTLGHASGDELLRTVGQLIRSSIRGEDAGFRCGGDEFVVLLPHTDAEQGKVLADRLTSLVDALGRTMKVPRPPRLSIGIATLGDCAERTAEGLLRAADRALYEVKRARRSQREGTRDLAPTPPATAPATP
jgi:diguanylate cyclase (GGDEF)-like protein